MKGLLFALVSTSFLSSVCVAQESKQQDSQELNVENYYQAIKFDRKTECVSDNKIYSVGMQIERDGKRFECNKYNLHATGLEANADASWKALPG